MFNEEWMVGLTAFYKDLYDYPTARRITVETELGLASFWRYFNLDYARSRGLEFQIKKRARRGLSGAFNFTYSRATGKSSREAEELDVGQGEAGESSLREYPLDWDRPISMQLSLSYFTPEDHYPDLFGFRLPDNWSFNLLWTLKSGVRYTPREYVSRAYGEENSALGPHVSWVNAKLEKRVTLSGMDVSFFVEGRNIFNRRNVRWVNPYTGDAWKLYDPDPDGTVPGTEDELQERKERNLNPSRYYEPRNIRAGMTFSW
jgi:outer membrane receptor protein involved in Fe transport